MYPPPLDFPSLEEAPRVCSRISVIFANCTKSFSAKLSLYYTGHGTFVTVSNTCQTSPSIRQSEVSFSPGPTVLNPAWTGRVLGGAVRSPWILYLVRNHFQTNCPAGHRSSETDEPFGQTFEPLDWFWLKNRNCSTIVSKCACSNGGEITLPVFKGGSSLRSRRILRSGTGVPQLEVGVLYPFESDSAIDLVAALDHPSKTFLLFPRSQRLAAWHTDEAVLGNIQDALRLLGETIPTDLGSPFKLRAKYLLVCLVRNTNVAQRIVATNTGVKGCLIPVIVLDCSLPTVWKQYKV